jgi:hypothetical protein
MTHKYSARNQHDLLYEVARAYPGGIEALAARLGTSAKKLYKKLSPKSPERNTTAEEFSVIVEMCEGAGVKNAMSPIEAMCWRHGGIFVPLDAINGTTDEDLRKTGIQAMTQLGNVAALVEEALERDELSDNDMERIEPAKRKLFATVALWWGRIKARKQRDSSKPCRSMFSRSQAAQVACKSDAGVEA